MKIKTKPGVLPNGATAIVTVKDGLITEITLDSSVWWNGHEWMPYPPTDKIEIEKKS